MRAKFQCTSVTEFAYGKQATLTAVYSGTPKDNVFAKATPSGDIKIHVDNPATKDYFQPGQKYYLDFSVAPE